MGRDEYVKIMRLCGFEDALDVLDSFIFFTLSPTSSQATPFSLKTSFCGSITTTAVLLLLMFIGLFLTVAQLQHVR